MVMSVRVPDPYHRALVPASVNCLWYWYIQTDGLQSAFAMINMGNDAKISDIFHWAAK